MPAVQQWGRRESIIWPPRRYLYTLGAIFLALRRDWILCLRPLSIWPFAARTLLPAVLSPHRVGRSHTSQSATINCSMFPIGKSRPRTALEGDVEPGATPQPTGGPLPLVLSSASAAERLHACCSASNHAATRTRLFTLGSGIGFMRMFLLPSSSRCNSFLVSWPSRFSFHFPFGRISGASRNFATGAASKAPFL